MQRDTWTRYLPGSLRSRVGEVVLAFRDLRSWWGAPTRPVCVSRHSEEELKDLASLWLNRRATRDGQEALRAELRELKVLEVQHPTKDSVKLVFENPAERPFRFKAGQFLTLLLSLEEGEVRRTYSMCSSPEDRAHIALTIKRVEGGRVSNYLNDHIQVGDSLRVLGPGGHFWLEPDPAQERALVFVAGGSGITPIYSMLCSLIEKEPASKLRLVYANKNRESTIFHDELVQLAQTVENFELVQLWEDGVEGEQAEAGRLDAQNIRRLVAIEPKAEYFVCGPAGMMDLVLEHLRMGGVEEDRISQERFVVAQTSLKEARGEEHALHFLDSGKIVRAQDTQTLLEAGLAAGIPMFFSCQMGGCAACKVQVDGDFEMDEPNCLTVEERAGGYCLACIARPRGPLKIKR